MLLLDFRFEDVSSFYDPDAGLPVSGVAARVGATLPLVAADVFVGLEGRVPVVAVFDAEPAPGGGVSVAEPVLVVVVSVGELAAAVVAFGAGLVLVDAASVAAELVLAAAFGGFAVAGVLVPGVAGEVSVVPSASRFLHIFCSRHLTGRCMPGSCWRLQRKERI